MTSATYLAFDYGTRRIGVAVGNTVSHSANPLDTIAVRNGQPDWDHISKLLGEWQPDALIVGEPFNMDDSDNEITLQARRFGNRLNGRYHLPVYLVDERLTSRAALSGMREAGYTAARSREEIDSHAACEILLDFLNDPDQKQTS